MSACPTCTAIVDRSAERCAQCGRQTGVGFARQAGRAMLVLWVVGVLAFILSGGLFTA